MPYAPASCAPASIQHDRHHCREGGRPVETIERRYADVVPLKRANEPEDIAAMVVFLASPGARNITGQSFNVDGGLIPD